jgi:hypothetical protein
VFSFSAESSHRRPTMSAFLPLLSNDRTSGAVRTKRLIYECTRLRCFAGNREKAPGRCPPCCQARSCGRGKAEAVGTDHWAQTAIEMFVVDAYLAGHRCARPSRPHRVSASLLVSEISVTSYRWGSMSSVSLSNGLQALRNSGDWCAARWAGRALAQMLYSNVPRLWRSLLVVA